MRSTMIAGMSLVAALAGVVAGAGALAQAGGDDPLLRPIEPEFAKRWLTPNAPTRLYGNTYLVGHGGLNVALIDTGKGLVLVDGGVPQGVLTVEDNIRKLGFKLSDIKVILSTEPHYDHAGGLAALARDSGATVIASKEAAETLRQGKSGPEDPQFGQLASFPPVEKVNVLPDKAKLIVGKILIYAYATPGHTAGSMSWGWKSCEASKCLNILFGSSLNPVSAPGYRFTDHAPIVASFRTSIARMRKLPCDILLSAHPDQSGGDVKFTALAAGKTPNPFIDPKACSAYADKFTGLLEARLAKEKQP